MKRILKPQMVVGGLMVFTCRDVDGMRTIKLLRMRSTAPKRGCINFQTFF